MKKSCFIVFMLISICGCAVNPAERNNAGNMLYDQGQFDSAISAYQVAQVAAPDSPEAYYNAAGAYAQTGAYDKAIATLHQALKTTDIDLKRRAYFNLGNVYFQMQQFDDAVEAYQQVLLLNPNDEDARHNLELAIKRLVVPSPTPISPTEQPTEEENAGATPTSDSSSQPTNAASPTASQSENSTPTPDDSNLPSTMNADDAESILDAVQQAQQSLPNQTLLGTPPAVESDKDW